MAPSSKFKTASVKVFVRTDLTAETATEVALLPYVLRHGTRELHSMRQINRRLEGLYGTQLGVDVLKLGEQQVLSFRLGLLGDAFLPEGEGVLEPALRLLADLLFDPFLPDGEGFRPDAVGQEAEKLRKFIEGLKNDKAAYAAEACVRAMCEGEPYAVFEYGALEDVARVSAPLLEARRRRLLQVAPIDVYVAGAFDPARARGLIEELFRVEGRPAELPALRGTTSHPARGAVREVREPMQAAAGRAWTTPPTGTRSS
jgi:predicted Zn-dependent peptidase